MTLCFIFRTSIPLLKYPFIVLFTISIYYLVVNIKGLDVKFNKEFIKSFTPVFLVTLLLIVAFYISKKLHLAIFKDIVSTLALIFFFIIFSTVIKTKEQLPVFRSQVLSQFLAFAIIISLFELARQYFSLARFVETPFLDNIFGVSQNKTESIDYNFALLPIFYSTILILDNWKRSKFYHRKIWILHSLYLILFTLAIIISGSRRGVVLLLLVFTVLLIIQLISIFKITNKNWITMLGNRSRLYLITILILFVISITTHKTTSYFYKNKCLTSLGIKGTSENKYIISSIFYRYIKFINTELDIKRFNKRFWSLDSEYNLLPNGIDPYNPSSGWGTRVHKLVYPLSGNNVNIVPAKSVGYMMDSSTNLNTWNNQLYSQTKVFSIPVKAGDSLCISAYCFVSNNFNAKSTSIYLNGLKTDKLESSYDNFHKNEWQKLELRNRFTHNDTVSMYLYWKPNSSEKNKIEGYVIFAYPNLKFLQKIDTNICSQSLILNPSQNIKKRNINSFIIDDFKFKRAGIFPFFISNSSNSILYKDSDPIRNFTQRIIKEDTNYYGLKSEFVTTSSTRYGVDSRTSRWKFARDIFIKEYGIKEKFVGDGFNYLNWFGYYFKSDKKKIDWPHNPFLSVLLYSGVLGLLVYLYFMYKVFYYYIKYRKEYGIFFIFFLITFFFSFFSANSPFNPPVMGFFVLLPFFIHYIHKKEGSNTLQSIEK